MDGDGEIAALLNEQGLFSRDGKSFHRLIIRNIRIAYSLTNRYDRLRARGLLTLPELGQQLSVSTNTIKRWRRTSLLKAHKYDDRGDYLFEQAGSDAPIKYRHQGKMTGRSTTIAAILSATTV